MWPVVAGRIRRRGERTQLVWVYLTRDSATGSRKWLSETVHGTNKDAKSVMHRLLHDRDSAA